MAKQSYSIKGTNIANGDAVGNQIVLIILKICNLNAKIQKFGISK